MIPYARIPEKAPEIDALEKKAAILERVTLRYLDRRGGRRFTSSSAFVWDRMLKDRELALERRHLLTTGSIDEY